MNFLKKIFEVMAIIGFFLVVGGAGRSDLADELHQYISMKDFLPQMIIGLLMMVPFGIVERNEEYDN